MNEKEMIEEMAKIILYCPYLDADMQAKRLYENGYRKIPEDSVVLDRQEHQKYCAYKIIEPQIKGCLDRERKLEKQIAELEKENNILQGTKDRLTFADRIKLVDNAVERKLKQFAERLKEKGKKASYIRKDNQFDLLEYFDDIDDTLKEFINEKSNTN